jgi:succinoglycan biosynthesis transport protein ExoP
MANVAPSPNQTPAQEQSIDLRSYWRIVSKRRWLILITFAVVMAIAVAYTLRLPKVYSASTTLIIETTAPKILGNGQVQDVAESSQPYWVSKEFYETQYNVLRSRAVAERVVQKLRTGRDDKLLGLDNVESAEAREKGLKALQSFRQAMSGRTDPASMVMGRVQVEPVKDSRITRLVVEDSDPLIAAALVNTFAIAYMEQNLASKSMTTNEATESLELRLPELDDRVQKATQLVTDFKKKNDVGASFEERQRLSGARMTKLSEELINVRIKKASLKARADAIATLKKSDNLDEVARAALIPDALASTEQTLKIKVLETRSECEQLEERLLAQHPKLMECKVKLANIARAYKAEIDTVLGRAQAEYANVAANEKNLVEELNAAKADAETMSAVEPEYLKLKRAQDTHLRLYEVALKSLRETDLSGNTRMNNVNVLDSARAVLSPSKPNVRYNLMMGLLFALVLSVGLAFGLEFLDNSISTQEQIEERLGLAFLGIVPSMAGKDRAAAHSDLVVFEQPKSAVAECCRAIRTNLYFMSPERPLRSILVTSAGPRDGKTTTAASLAITMAESGHRVLLVDADLRRPRIHSAFKIANTSGLSSLILGEGILKETAKSSGVPNLSLLTCGPLPPNPAELLHTEAFKNLLAQMGEQFDRVIIDSPPIGAVADAVVISTQVDGTVLVVKNQVTSREMARRAVKALRDVNARIFGAILNDVDLEARQAGGYYYYSKYGYYYGESESKKTTPA